MTITEEQYLSFKMDAFFLEELFEAGLENTMSDVYYNCKIQAHEKLLNFKKELRINPFESIENYMSAVWNENLSDSYIGESYGYNKAVIFGSTGFFEDFRVNNISPYKAMLAFVELEKSMYEK